jgi:hypothetical protein
VLVVGYIDADTLEELVAPLEPDAVGPASSDIPPSIGEKHQAPASVIWWD